jgi:uncharacterized membrane protein YfcA
MIGGEHEIYTIRWPRVRYRDIGGVVGLGLVQLRLPAMIQVLGVDPRIAAGTNLVISTFTGLFGFIGHLLTCR